MNDIIAALGSLNGQICSLEPRIGAKVSLLIGDSFRGVPITDDRAKVVLGRGKDITALSAIRRLPSASGKSSIAFISARGIALYDFELQPLAFSAKQLARDIESAARDPAIAAIAIEMDSPGGSVTGIREAADALFSARAKKPVTVLIDPLSASAGYWIASQASQVIAVPSAEVGSIGVYMLHVDASKALADAGLKPTFIYAGERKVEGNGLEPLSSDAKAFYQVEVDRVYREFLHAVARGRGVSVSRVKSDFGQGRLTDATKAKEFGMIDAIMTPDRAVAQIANSRAALSAEQESNYRLLALLSA